MFINLKYLLIMNKVRELLIHIFLFTFVLLVSSLAQIEGM